MSNIEYSILQACETARKYKKTRSKSNFYVGSKKSSFKISKKLNIDICNIYYFLLGNKYEHRDIIDIITDTWYEIYKKYKSLKLNTQIVFSEEIVEYSRIVANYNNKFLNR